MSRKIDPIGLRVGITKPWLSSWFAEGDRYADRVVEDAKIRAVLRKKLRTAGLDSILIERSIKSVKIIIRVTRPGVVIGRKGTGLSQIRESIKKITKDDIDLLIEEVKQPELSAPVVAETIAMQIEKRVSPKRAINVAADKAMESGAKGIKIEAGGTLFGPNSMGTVITTSRGPVPTQTLRADIDYAKTVAYTRGGTIGIKVWIYKGEEK